VTLEETIAALDSFVPSGEEYESVARLDEIVDPLVDPEQIKAATPAMLRVFERFPHTLLGSPGPLVHCVERTSIETYLPVLLESFKRQANRMTLWMIDRCLRADLPTQLRFSILSTLREIRRAPDAVDLHDEIDEKLEEYGNPRR
jgi:hypothetical protein